MKTAKKILVIFLSLLLMYLGGGVSVIAYCLSGCKPGTIEKCCCCKAPSSSEEEYSFVNVPCCGSTVYQMDLQKTPLSEGNVYFPLIMLPQQDILFQNDIVEREEVTLATYYPPPKPDTSRFYLHYFSTLLI